MQQRARLTQEQRAARRVTRKNNRARRDLPLLAWADEQPKTTVEVELHAVRAYDTTLDRWRHEHETLIEEFSREAACLRAQVARHVCADELSFLDSLVAASCPFDQPVYLLTAWIGLAGRDWSVVEPWESRWASPYEQLRLALWRGDEAAVAAAREAIKAEARAAARKQ